MPSDIHQPRHVCLDPASLAATWDGGTTKLSVRLQVQLENSDTDPNILQGFGEERYALARIVPSLEAAIERAIMDPEQVLKDSTYPREENSRP